jgi:uncharacterized protein DUF5824
MQPNGSSAIVEHMSDPKPPSRLNLFAALRRRLGGNPLVESHSGRFAHASGKLPNAIQEMIGSGQRIIRRFILSSSPYNAPTRDAGVTDYRFMDRARSGKAQGLEISGLLLKPFTSKITSWTLGKQPTLKLDNEQAQTELTDWFTAHYRDIKRVYKEALDLGDCYLVVNADLSLTIIPPHVIRKLVARDDLSQVIGWRIEEAYIDPSDPARRMTIRDDYRLDGRTRTTFIDAIPRKTEEFRNPLGRLPIVALHNRKKVDEDFGRPEMEACVTLLQKYGEVIESAISGNKRQGRPTPVVERMGTLDDITAFWEQHAQTETRTLPDGTTETNQYLQFDADKLWTLSGEATFRYASPGSFTADTTAILQLLFYLMVEHGEIPEFILGNAIQGSMASTESQIEPFVKFIEDQQTDAEAWLLEILSVVMAIKTVINPRTFAGLDAPTVAWEKLTKDDGQLTLETVKWGHERGLIDNETALRLIPVEIENPQEVLKKAQAEAAERKAAFEASVDQNINQAERNTARDEDNQPPVVRPVPATPKAIAAMAGDLTGGRYAHESGELPLSNLEPPFNEFQPPPSGHFGSTFNERYGTKLKSRSLPAIAQVVAEEMGVSKEAMLTALKEVYRRGEQQWATGHKPGITRDSWARSRVYSFVMQGKAWTETDHDLAAPFEQPETQAG